MTMELPEYGDTRAVKEALTDVRRRLAEMEREVKALLALECAVRSMCRHEMVSDSDARMPTISCEHCGFSRDGRRHFTVYG